MKKKVVYEYITDSSGIILQIQCQNPRKRPDLIDNPPPPFELTPETFHDQYGRPCWLLQNGEINKVDLGEPTPVEDAQRFIQELSTVEMLKLLFKGIQNKNDDDYEDFVDKVNLL